jgi:hypothetical protein
MDATAPLTLKLALFLFFCAFVLNGLIYVTAPEQLKENALTHSWDALNGAARGDSGATGLPRLFHKATATPLSEIFFNRLYRFDVRHRPVQLCRASFFPTMHDETQISPPDYQRRLGWIFLRRQASPRHCSG